MPEIHNVYDFRDAPMRVRASFESRADADAWARAQFGEHGWVPPGTPSVDESTLERIDLLEGTVASLRKELRDQRLANDTLEHERIENRKLLRQVDDLTEKLRAAMVTRREARAR